MLEKRNKDKDLEKDLSMHSNNNKCKSCYEITWAPYRYYFARKKQQKLKDSKLPY